MKLRIGMGINRKDSGRIGWQKESSELGMSE
jgi:hypothetical protein